MSRLALAEMVCDVVARSSEFGTSVFEWIDTVATKKYKFKKNDEIHKQIMFFLELLLDKPFTALKK